MSDFVAVSCPFCGGLDFDKIGLKIHLESGHCDEYNETPRYETFPVLDRPADSSKLIAPCPECGRSGLVPCRLIGGCENGTCPYPEDCNHRYQERPCPTCQGKEEE